MVDRFKTITDVHVFLKNDNDDILMLRRANTGYEDGYYSVIAGHLDGHEEVMEAAIREAKEETGIEIRYMDIKVVGVMHRKQDDERISFFLSASRWSGDIINMEPERCDDLSWFPICDLPVNTIPYVRRAIENWVNGLFFDSYGWR
ncbi:MAG: NUDIX domain-containing protein [Gemmatimonadetes bacterium]|nr:NUDIX domain-containing protein [Gemmatimonadota bacterium]MYG85516.1 NUDIX domain-containing protein [Gemmatimonadota bacterium]MYJ91161.1 NUDIX domain-containing protein [Gemmatimonadota bacterium]